MTWPRPPPLIWDGRHHRAETVPFRMRRSTGAVFGPRPGWPLSSDRRRASLELGDVKPAPQIDRRLPTDAKDFPENTRTPSRGTMFFVPAQAPIPRVRDRLPPDLTAAQGAAREGINTPFGDETRRNLAKFLRFVGDGRIDAALGGRRPRGPSDACFLFDDDGGRWPGSWTVHDDTRFWPWGTRTA